MINQMASNQSENNNNMNVSTRPDNNASKISLENEMVKIKNMYNNVSN